MFEKSTCRACYVDIRVRARAQPYTYDVASSFAVSAGAGSSFIASAVVAAAAPVIISVAAIIAEPVNQADIDTEPEEWRR